MDNCIICSDNLEIEEIQYLQCFHKFHKSCINKWIEIKPNCPLCNFQTNMIITNIDEKGNIIGNKELNPLYDLSYIILPNNELIQPLLDNTSDSDEYIEENT